VRPKKAAFFSPSRSPVGLLNLERVQGQAMLRRTSAKSNQPPNFGGRMKTTASLNGKIVQAVQTSMRIEGYKPTQSVKVKAQAKALMKERRVEVSISGK
jgi:hypothetical protein